MSKVIVTLTKSTNKANQKQERIVRALGLKKIGQSVLHEDNPAIRGMVAHVPHLVTIQDVQD